MKQPREIEQNDTNILDLVMTTKEASEKYDVADSTFRIWIKEGMFNPQDIKKSGNTWLLKKEAIETILRNKNMFGRTFVLDDEKIYAEHLGYKSKTIQIWYENSKTKDLIENMPHKELVMQMLEVFKQDTKMNYKFVLIDDNTEDNENWFFRKEKVWVLTFKGVAETIRHSMKLKEFNTKELDAYLKELNISI